MSKKQKPAATSVEAVLRESKREEEARILVKEFIQGLVLGFLAGVLATWFALVH